jgi:predicted nucleic-acid-binding protein
VKVTLDTNVLVRLATQDDPAQAALALEVLNKASLIAVPNTALCEMVWVLLRGYRYTPAQVSHAVRTLIQVRHVVCNTPAVLAGLALLESGGDFADGVIAFEGELLGGHEFVTLDQRAAKLLKAQKRKIRLLQTEIGI